MARAALAALLVAAVLVGSTIGSAAVLQPSPRAQMDDGRTSDIGMLGLDSPARSEVATQGVDVSTAVAIQRVEASAAIDRGALEAAFERTGGEQERRELLFEAATDVEIAIAALRSGQRDVRSDFVNGSITPRDYLRSRALAAGEAERLRGDLAQIQRFADRVPQLSMRSRLQALQVSLTGVEGPVTKRLGATIDGRKPSVEAYVAVSRNGRVLAMSTDGEYVREAHRTDVWTPDTTSGIAFAQAEKRIKTLYPVAFNSSRNLQTTMGDHGAGTYRITMEIAEGNIVAYLDGDTRNVFHEAQRFDLASIVPGPPVSASDNGIRLVINRTYEGGPLRIATFDNTTGTPADVPVMVGNNSYRTGSDGVVWALQPTGRTKVVAMAEGGNVSVSSLQISPAQVDINQVG